MKLHYYIIDSCCCLKQGFKNCYSSISDGFKKLFTRKKYVNMDDGETHFQTEYSSEEHVSDNGSSMFVPYYDGKLEFNKDGKLRL